MKKYPSETIEKISEFLFIEESIKNLPAVDLVIVFGSEFIEGTVDELEKLIDSKIILPTTKVILTGNVGSLNSNEKSEAKRMYEEVISRNLNKDLFIIEDKATNAYENLLFSKDIILNIGGFEKYNNILFVAKSFMLRRTKMCASKLEYPVNKIHYYGLVDANGRNISKNEWFKSDVSKKRVLEELERIGKYAVKGDIDIFD